MAPEDVAGLRPAEFCALERDLVAGMAMRKKRNVKMGPVQQLKLRLLEHVQAADPEASRFSAILAEAVVVVSEGLGTGPAQAVASDLQMDWDLARASPGFVHWLRSQTRAENEKSPPPTSGFEGGGGRRVVGADPLYGPTVFDG